MRSLAANSELSRMSFRSRHMPKSSEWARLPKVAWAAGSGDVVTCKTMRDRRSPECLPSVDRVALEARPSREGDGSARLLMRPRVSGVNYFFSSPATGASASTTAAIPHSPRRLPLTSTSAAFQMGDRRQMGEENVVRSAKIGVQERDVFSRADRRTVTSLGELRKV